MHSINAADWSTASGDSLTQWRRGMSYLFPKLLSQCVDIVSGVCLLRAVVSVCTSGWDSSNNVNTLYLFCVLLHSQSC